MPEQEKKELNAENLEVTELEDNDLEEVGGGLSNVPEFTQNSGCPTSNTGCS
jgi:hypothetical protein